MQRKLLVSLFAVMSVFTTAGNLEDCTKAAGTFLSGTVVKGPTFKPGSYLNGVELSHTHLQLNAEQDGKTYEVAIDNVFAAGYDSAGESVPTSLASISVGTRLGLCGLRFPGGIHWVHTNCGETPNSQHPDGWVKLLDANNQASESLTGKQEYCRLWSSKRG